MDGAGYNVILYVILHWLMDFRATSVLCALIHSPQVCGINYFIKGHWTFPKIVLAYQVLSHILFCLIAYLASELQVICIQLVLS